MAEFGDRRSVAQRNSIAISIAIDIPSGQISAQTET